MTSRTCSYAIALSSLLALGACDSPAAPSDAGRVDGGGGGADASTDAGPRDGGRDAGSDAGAACTVGCDWVEVALGSSSSCARRENGDVWCWGRNEVHELGDGVERHGGGCAVGPALTEDCTSTAVRAALSAPATSLEAAGGPSACALIASGVPQCWGLEAFNWGGDTAMERPRPEAFPGLTGVTAVADNFIQVCAIGAGGAVLCAGANSSGQCGNGMQMEQLNPVMVQRRTAADPTMGEPLTGVVELAVGTSFGSHVCARTADTLYCWGSNDQGQLGLAAGTGDVTPCMDGMNPYECVRFAAPVPGIDASMITQISVGRNHTCALMSDRTVQCWGENRAGQLGMGDLMARLEPTPVPGIADAVQVAAGGAYTCIRFMDGTVRCVGINEFGQLGDGMMDHPEQCTIGVASLDCSSTFTTVSGIDDASDLDVSGSHACVIRDTANEVWCWGNNNMLQLGVGGRLPTMAERAPRFAPIRAAGLR